MLNLFGSTYRTCDGVSRREVLRVGTLGFGGLTLADVLRLRAHGAEPASKHKSVIMVYLPGGPSHIDMYDLKPDAPAEFRGEFKPIRTKVPGLDICELMPKQAEIADKLVVLRGLVCFDTHSAELLTRGTLTGPKRPVFGSVVSRSRPHVGNGMPPYVALGGENGADSGDPVYLGQAHRPFTSGASGLANLRLTPEVSLDRLGNRQSLLRAFDTMNRDVDDGRGVLQGLDAFSSRALEMIRTPQVREAFDLTREPAAVRERYGRAERLLLALRLAQAGVSVVTVSMAGTVLHGGDWDTHAGTDQRSETNFQNLRGKLPVYDRAVHTLITDLYDRGLDKDIAIVVWGEFGRTPRINKNGGRDHWAPAGSAILAGGGWRMGQVIGETGPRAERSTSADPYTPANVLSSLYRHLGIDPERTFPDFSGRPMYVLDDRRPIAEL